MFKLILFFLKCFGVLMDNGFGCFIDYRLISNKNALWINKEILDKLDNVRILRIRRLLYNNMLQICVT
jgi:hypothetical protein